MIDSAKVEKVFLSCLYKGEEGKPIANPVYVEGVSAKFVFHPERLKEASAEIEGFIKELPDNFKKGWSFLNLCLTKNEELWTGLHEICEELMVLGVATGKMEYCFPKEMWGVLPGGLPYIQVI